MRVSLVILAVSFCLPGLSQAPDGGPVIVARLMSQPPLSPEEVAIAEAKLVDNPGDLNLRLRLLTHYRDTAPAPSYDDAVKRSVRLRHILYLIEHHPNVLDAASPLVYVPRANAPYANESDHAMVRSAWARVVAANPTDTRIILNAAWFLFVEHKQESEETLRDALNRDPGNQRLAANLGFLYAMQILTLDGFSFYLSAQPIPVQNDAKQRAVTELESSSNAAVLAGAATAIPNLAMRTSRGGQVDPELFQISSRLMAKAREIAREDETFRGPMPMIEYFQEAQQLASDRSILGRARMVSGAAMGAVLNDSEQPGMPVTPSRVRIGGGVLKSKMVHTPQPEYPELAKRSGIAGDVRFDAVLAVDGSIAALTLRSGHPLLVAAATNAVKQWRYQPTLLNGKPVEVATEIVVSFSPEK